MCLKKSFRVFSTIETEIFTIHHSVVNEQGFHVMVVMKFQATFGFYLVLCSCELYNVYWTYMRQAVECAMNEHGANCRM
jgi:hypothetical protein